MQLGTGCVKNRVGGYTLFLIWVDKSKQSRQAIVPLSLGAGGSCKCLVSFLDPLCRAFLDAAIVPLSLGTGGSCKCLLSFLDPLCWAFSTRKYVSLPTEFSCR